MTLTIRATCQVCKRRRRVRRDGKIRSHYQWELIQSDRTAINNGRGPLCFGSDALPLEMLRHEEQSYFCNVGCSGCSDVIKYGI